MTGKTKPWYQQLSPEQIPLGSLFMHQQENQQRLLDLGLYDNFKSEETKTVPIDDVRLMSYHIQQLISEIGEVLDADARWKNFRNQFIDEDNKIEEIADCFIVLMNIAMFSGFDGSQVAEAIANKLNKVSDRISNL